MTALLAPAAGINLDLCMATFGSPAHVQGVEKDSHDLWRYEKIIELTRPDVLIECGTHTGHSALWFSTMVPLVITIDIDHSRVNAPLRDNIIRMLGDTTDPKVMRSVTRILGTPHRRRVMISLDSDHTPEHVRAEITLWAHLVSVGCYLVIEDGIYHWAPKTPDQANWDPLVGISAAMPYRRDFIRDHEVEGMYPITGAMAGWWRAIRERTTETADTGGRV